MRKLRVFISSVQQEFEKERLILAEYIRHDRLLGQFFEPFLFEWLPATDQRSDSVYLDAVNKCEIYLGLFGLQYGFENQEGLSPTELEFHEATISHRIRLVFIRGNQAERNPKMQDLVSLAESQLVRKRFSDIADLKTNVYSALVEILMQRGHIQNAPFDATIHPHATPYDINEEKVRNFVSQAKSKRGFPLRADAPVSEILTHLNLLSNGRLTHAALLLFGSNPQKWFTSAIIKCAQFHGSEIAKPIPAHRDLHGDVFEQIDKSVDFVLSRLSVSAGTRSGSNDVTIQYEIPRTAVAEAIVNAVAHRDYTSTGSVQVMIFSNRIEIWNPGFLPPNLSIEQLRKPHASFPANPLLAEPMYQAGYIERMGTGTGDMIRDCISYGLAEPVFLQEDVFKTILWRKTTLQVTPQVAPQVTLQVDPILSLKSTDNLDLASRLLLVISGEMSRQMIMESLGLKDRHNFRENYLNPALDKQWIEMTNPNARGSNQAYRLTRKGKLRLTKLKNK